MAITQTGSTLQFGFTGGSGGNGNTGTVSSTITVPADAEIVIVGVSAFQGTAAGLEAMTFTKGGSDTAMTRVASDSSSALWQVAIFYLNAPDTGTNKTAKWDWIGTAVSGAATPLFSITFWKGIDTASPVRSSGAGTQTATLPCTTGTLTALSGDLIVAFAGFYCNSVEGSIDSWSNLSLLTNCTFNVESDAAWATGSPSGNTTVAASTGTNWNAGGGGSLVAAVLAPAAGGTTTIMFADQARS